MIEFTLPRRTFLRGLGTALALPFLEAMLPARLFAGEVRKRFPRRLAFLYVPNGINMADWTPAAAGPLGRLPRILKPLDPFQADLLVLSGLTQDKARPNGDGPGDHARAAASFLTGCQAFKTHGADIRVGVSVDQVAARMIGGGIRFPSLELGCDRGMNSGNCDSGYSCAYSANISWKTESMPMAKETDPKAVFERLFGNGSRAEAAEGLSKRERQQKSVLDFVREDARRLQAKLGATDRRKLEQYFAAVREIEQRLDQAKAEAKKPDQDGGLPAQGRPAGIPKDYAEHMRLLCDLLALAFQADLTRVATFMLANEGSNRSYSMIGVSDGHHDLSHHGGNKEKQEKIHQINHFHIQQFAHLLSRLKEAKEGDGTVLDHCMIVYGSGIGDGNRHNHNDLPVLLAGRAGGTILPGRHLLYPKDTPLNNLFLSMLDRIDASTDKLGDSTGRLSQLFGPTRNF
ncbi:MAG: DUF1552 domain-containing protein [Planctomycetes bacterium]|nr:DUF1552 domain-containing protein [Planctomycetota bacterium]